MQPETLDFIEDHVSAPSASTPAPLDGEAALLELENDSASTLLPSREPWAARLAGRMGRHHAVLMLLSTLLLCLVAALPSQRGALDLEIGKPAPREVLAPTTALVPDAAATELRRRDAAALVPPVYDGDAQAQRHALARLRVLLTQSQAKVRNPKSEIRNQLRWDLVSDAATSAINAVYRRAQIRSDVPTDIAAAQMHIADDLKISARQEHLNSTEISRAAQLARAAARAPNLIVNERATQRARREAQDGAHAVYERIQAGDTVLQAGEIVSPEKWAQLQTLGLLAPRFAGAAFWKAFGARAALCVLLVFLAAGYLATLDRSMLKKPAALWLAAMTPLLFLALYRVLLPLPHADLFLIPLAATAAMLLTILLEARVGILAGLLIAAPGVLLAQGDAGLFLSAALAAWIGALGVANISSRRQVGRAALLLVVANTLLTLVFGTLRDTPLETLYSLVLWSVLAGVFSVIAAIGLAMAIERPFGITTPLRLMELLSPDEPVLRRLQTEAPGTYTHSLMVSLLAENAAKCVEADALLSRVGGLYHDIGKLRRPHCFIENQGGDNIHERLSPQLSSRVIIAHVRDGLALGRALKLPQPVLDVIGQHHGNSRTEYFYRRALEQNELLETRLQREVEESIFRYPGPRPQSKEAAIVMLADTIEASARALPQPTLEKLKHHVAAMIAQKLREGELDECDLTLRDLTTVEDAFLHVLRGALHHRIAYPVDRAMLSTPSATADGASDELAALQAQLQKSNADAKTRSKSDVKDSKFGAVIGKRKLRRLRRMRATEDTSTPVAQNGAFATETVPVETVASTPLSQPHAIQNQIDSAHSNGDLKTYNGAAHSHAPKLLNESLMSEPYSGAQRRESARRTSDAPRS